MKKVCRKMQISEQTPYRRKSRFPRGSFPTATERVGADVSAAYR